MLAKDWECGAWQMTTCFMTVSTSMNIIIIIPLEEAFPSYDSPAGDARVIQSGVKGVYLPWYVFNLPLQNRPHISSALLTPLSGELILIRLSDIISQMVWILWTSETRQRPRRQSINAAKIAVKMWLLCRVMIARQNTRQSHGKLFPTVWARETITDLGPGALLCILPSWEETEPVYSLLFFFLKTLIGDVLKALCQKWQSSGGKLAPRSQKTSAQSHHMFNLLLEASLSKTFTSPSLHRCTLSSVTHACHISSAVVPPDISTLISTRASACSFSVLQALSNMSF